MPVQHILTEPATHWPVYLAILLVGAAIGYLANIVANRLLFAPIRFRGWSGPRLGLQGAVPRNADRLATLHAELVSGALLDAQELLTRLEPSRIAEEIGSPLRRAVDQLIMDVATHQSPALWEMLPGRLKRLLIDHIRDESPTMVANIVEEITVDAADVFDLRHLIHSRLSGDVALLNSLIDRIGRPTLRAAPRYGAAIGTLLGVLTLLVFGFTGSPLVLPAAGLLIGLMARCLATPPLFRPMRRRTLLGALTWQGSFPSRRAEVATGYGTVLADEVITFDAIVTELTSGTNAERMAAIMRREVHRTIDSQLSLAKPLVVAAIGSRQFQRIKREAAEKALERMPDTIRSAAGYATGVMDVHNTISYRVRQLPPQRYELLLRPAVDSDRWRLLPLCALLGAVVGGIGMVIYGYGSGMW